MVRKWHAVLGHFVPTSWYSMSIEVNCLQGFFYAMNLAPSDVHPHWKFYIVMELKEHNCRGSKISIWGYICQWCWDKFQLSTLEPEGVVLQLCRKQNVFLDTNRRELVKAAFTKRISSSRWKGYWLRRVWVWLTFKQNITRINRSFP